MRGLLVGAAVLLAGLGVVLVSRRQVEAAAVPEPVQSSGDGWTWENVSEEVGNMVNQVQAGADEAAGVGADLWQRNIAAFLMAIRHAEGTAGPDGYRTMFGGGLFSGWADHPRVAHQFTDKAGRRLWTSAAGAYQFMAVSRIPTGGSTRVNTWDRIKAKLSLPDFSPASQDAAAVELIDEAGALADVRAGRFDVAVNKVRRIWASMPGAGYQQGERSLAWLRDKYSAAGGVYA